MEREQEVEQGKQAEFILTHPLFKAAFEEIEGRLIEEIRNCPIRDREGLQELSLMLKMATRVRTAFLTHVETGKLAQEQLRRDKPLFERVWPK